MPFLTLYLLVSPADNLCKQIGPRPGQPMSLPKKNNFFRETPISPWVPFRAKFWPIGCPMGAQAYSLGLYTYQSI